jgi:hypothetical protein
MSPPELLNKLFTNSDEETTTDNQSGSPSLESKDDKVWAISREEEINALFLKLERVRQLTSAEMGQLRGT